MIGQFNPYRAGSPVQLPNVSARDLLLGNQAQNESLGNLINSVSNVGTIARSEDVAKALSSKDLANASANDALAKLVTLSSGGVDANSQNLMNNFVQDKRAIESANALAQSNLTKEQMKAQQELVKQKLVGDQRLAKQQLVGKQNLDKVSFEAKADEGIERLKHSLNIDAAKRGELPDQWGVLGNGVLYNRTTGQAIAPEEYKKIQKQQDIVKELPRKAEEWVRGLSPNQRKNWEEEYSKGNWAWQDEVRDKKTNKLITRAGFFDLTSPTAPWVNISNKVKEKR